MSVSKLRILVIVVFTLVITGLIALIVFLNERETLVQDGQIHLSELQNPVQVYFDQSAVPYIKARSEGDLLLAQGYITASERIFQMDILRRLAKGEMAAVYGASCLSSDKLSHILGFKRLAKAEYKMLSGETKKWLNSYCRGVNAYLAEYSRKLPLEFVLSAYEPQAWQPEDTLAILKYLQYASDECWQLNILRDSIKEKAGVGLARQMFGLWPDHMSLATDSDETKHSESGRLESRPLESRPLESRQFDFSQLMSGMPPVAKLSWGSNGWLVAKKMSQSGGCLLACDKHALFTFPDLFFACSLRAPGVHVAGLSIPGVPGILIGRNNCISWAPINLKGRWQDLTFAQFSQEHPDQYLEVGSRDWLKAEGIEEEIEQRFFANIIEKVWITRRGPVLTKNEHQIGAVLNWYGFDPQNSTIESIWQLNKASNWSEFQAALEKYRGSPQLFLYADTAGNIKKQIAGHLHEQLSAEQSEDEAEFIVANQATPAASTRLANIGALSNNWSCRRVHNLLNASQKSGKKLSLEEMIALQADTKAPLSELMVKTLRCALKETNSADKYQQEAFTLLSGWDGQLKAGSAGACIYESFLVALTKTVLQAKLGMQLTNDYIDQWPRWSEFSQQIMEKQTAVLLPWPQRAFAVFIVNCFSQSLNNLRITLLSGKVQGQVSGNLAGCQWQNLHALDFRTNLAKYIPQLIVNIVGLLLPPTIGIGGDQDSVNACNYALSEYAVTNKPPQYICNSGPTARLLIDMADNDKFYQSLTTGQCGHLFSRDRIDDTMHQLNLWRNEEFHAVAFSDQELNILARHSLTLSNEE